MDYENYAVPALNLARARIAASGGCMGCPTCGVGSGMFMGGKGSTLSRKVFELKAANPAMTFEEAAAYIAANTPPPKPPREVYFGPRMATKAQLAALARKEARAAARAERNACFTNCRTAYQATLPVRGQRQRSAAQLANDERLRKMGKARRKRPLGIQQVRRNRNRGRGLETGNGLDFGSGMQYY
jgi:hypothetical protein